VKSRPKRPIIRPIDLKKPAIQSSIVHSYAARGFIALTYAFAREITT
jgi:hypothetical protein